MGLIQWERGLRGGDQERNMGEALDTRQRRLNEGIPPPGIIRIPGARSGRDHRRHDSHGARLVELALRHQEHGRSAGDSSDSD
eukprot:9775415-Lingulodinium_polyedra.AAC.1